MIRTILCLVGKVLQQRLIEGVTRRDYLMAHCPYPPASFVPESMRPKPVVPPESHPLKIAEENRHKKALTAWEEERKLLASIHWPAFWADTMLG